MKRYLEYYENEWPENIEELTAIDNKPFVGYLNGEGVKYTVVPKPVTGPADNEIWYTTVDGNPHDFFNRRETLENQGMIYSGPELLSNRYDSAKQLYIATFDDTITGLGLDMDSGASTLSYKYVTVTASNISKIWLPNKIESLNYFGISGNNELTELIIPDTVTHINFGCIYEGNKLYSISIPSSTLKIEQNSVVLLPSLGNIEFRGTIEQWNNIDKEENWIVECPLATYVQCSDGQVTL